jgi:hypothetical protein
MDLPGERGYVTVDRPAGQRASGAGAGYYDEAFQPLGERHYSDLSLPLRPGRGSGAGTPTGLGGQSSARHSTATTQTYAYGDPYDDRHRVSSYSLSGGKQAQGHGAPTGTALSSAPTLLAHDIPHSHSVRERELGIELGSNPIPKGYALAQLLPSRTVRLTIRVPRPFAWRAGQSVLLYLPELARWQSHPFTILNAPRAAIASGAGAGSDEVVLLVKARKGLTWALYETVRTRSARAVREAEVVGEVGNPYAPRGASGASGVGKRIDAAPVYIRAKVDGPFGSAARVRWESYASVLLVCGGSGVSFGMGVLEDVVGWLGEGRGRVRRVRLVWIAREYGECAVALFGASARSVHQSWPVDDSLPTAECHCAGPP